MILRRSRGMVRINCDSLRALTYWTPASLVATTLAETRDYLEGVVEIPRIPAPAPGSEPQLSLIASA